MRANSRTIQNLEVDPTPEQEMKDDDGEYGRVLVNAYVRFRDRKGVYSNGLSCGKATARSFLQRSTATAAAST